ncbi:MAG TPA: Lrp/AsnC ligand binding domain-containing protein [Candidatus Acidoferrales bacterium]|nr:Lrp/AsnC ligand binding domain-containing protein [Candidatus Acidoferrales bacterium]
METLYMPQAYVLINVESGAEEEVVSQLKTIEGVVEAYYSYGVYDIISKVKADSMEKLKDLVTRKIRTQNRVRSTLTLIMMEE